MTPTLRAVAPNMDPIKTRRLPTRMMLRLPNMSLRYPPNPAVDALATDHAPTTQGIKFWPPISSVTVTRIAFNVTKVSPMGAPSEIPSA